MKLVSLSEAADLLGLKLNKIHYFRLNFKFPLPVSKKIDRGGTINLYRIDEIRNAVENRISLATGLPVNEAKGKQRGHNSYKNFDNNGGQYIHYGYYEVDKSWNQKRSSYDGEYHVEI